MTTWLKDNKWKSQVELIQPDFLLEIGYVLKNWADKYWANTRQTVPLSSHIWAALRHIYKFEKWEDNDEESWLPHIIHAVTNLMFVYHNYKNKLSKDFREELKKWNTN